MISLSQSSRWALICTICREKTGACIQCSVKTCKTAFHVTCAFRNGLEMRTILNEDNEEDDVKLQVCFKKIQKNVYHYRGLFKRRQAVKITACYSYFAGCSPMCLYVHILSEDQYSRLFS